MSEEAGHGMPAARDPSSAGAQGGAARRPAEPVAAAGRTSALGRVAALWGIAGVVALLGYAAWRLGGHALEMLAMPLGPVHWAALAAWVVFMAWSEGYRGFQQAFSPRTAARARHLAERPQALRVALAPAFCMGFFHATTRRMITTYALTGAIVAFVALARLLEQPWRGILDAGVVVGLAWGILSLLWSAWAAFTDPRSAVPAEVPRE